MACKRSPVRLRYSPRSLTVRNYNSSVDYIIKNLPSLLEQIFCFNTPEPIGEANCNCSTGDPRSSASYSGLTICRQVYLSGFLFSEAPEPYGEVTAMKIAFAVREIPGAAPATPVLQAAYFLTLSTRTGIRAENSDLGIVFFSQRLLKNPRLRRKTQSRSGLWDCRCSRVPR